MRRVIAIVALLLCALTFWGAVPKDDAVATVTDKLLKGKMNSVRVWVYPDVRHEGETITSWTKQIPVPFDSWMFFVDDMPGALWTHPARYIFIGADNGEVKIVKGDAPPDIMSEMKELTHWYRPAREIPPAEIKSAILSTMSADSSEHPEHLYAVLMNGGYMPSQNFMAFWNDLSFAYITLTQVYGYDQNHIIVFCSDGTDPAPDREDGTSSPLDLDGDGDDDIQYPADLGTFTTVIDSLSGELSMSDQFSFFFIDHGGQIDSTHTNVALWTGFADDHDFAVRLSPLPAGSKIISIDACHSGGFIDDFDTLMNCVITTAARFDEYGWGTPGAYGHGFYDYCFLVALSRTNPDGWSIDDPSTADYDGDGFISIREAYVYTVENDASAEHPQYACTPDDFGEHTFLFGGDFGQPYIKTNDPELVESDGDGDSIPDPGEEFEYHPYLLNVGTTAYNVDVGLSSGEPDISISGGLIHRDSLVYRDSSLYDESFAFRILGSADFGDTLHLDLSVTADSGYSRVFPITVVVLAPDIYFTYTILDTFAEDDHDGEWDPGERITVLVPLINHSSQEAMGVWTRLAPTTTSVEMVQDSIWYGDIAGGGTAGGSGYFVVRALASAEDNTVMGFNLSIRESRGWHTTLGFAMPLGGGFVPGTDSTAWEATGWHLSYQRRINGKPSWYNSTDGLFTYPDSTDMTLTSVPFVLPTSATLFFDRFYAGEPSYDKGFVEISTDAGASWTEVWRVNNYQPYWRTEIVDLSSFPMTDLVRLRFRFHSSASVSGEGWYLSNIRVVPNSAGCLGAGYHTPNTGFEWMMYRFWVTYYNRENDPPDEPELVVDGVRYTMYAVEGLPSQGQRWFAAVPLTEGVHSWHCEFHFPDGFARFPEEGEITGPIVVAAVDTIDIADSSAGFTHSGANDVWEWGEPSGGPSAGIPYGDNVWATELSGDYPSGLGSAMCRLESQWIDLTDVDVPVFVIYQWYEMEHTAYGMLQGAGNVKALTSYGDTLILYPDRAYDGIAASGNPMIWWQQGFGGNTLGGNQWAPAVFDFSYYPPMDSVRLLFDFGGSADCASETSPGWYINNIFLLDKGVSDVGEARAGQPERLFISAYPNPFNGSVRIDAPKGATVEIYTTLGQLVRTLPKGCRIWDGCDRLGVPLNSGIYLVTVKNKTNIATTKALLIK